MSDIIEKAKAQQLEFFKVEVETGLTFARLACSRIEQGEVDAARRDLDVARAAYYSLLKHRTKAELSGAATSMVEEQIAMLLGVIDDAESRFAQAGSGSPDRPI